MFTKSGTYCYNPEGHTLTLIAEGDNRALTGTLRQAFVAKGAVDLLYVQDAGKWPEGRPADIVLHCGFAHAGLSIFYGGVLAMKTALILLMIITSVGSAFASEELREINGVKLSVKEEGEG